MNTRERFKAVMDFKPFDRLPIVEWAVWWDLTIKRWHSEGLSESVQDRYDIYKYFDLEMYKQDWLPICTAECPKPASHGGPIISTEKDYDKLRKYLYPKNVIDQKISANYT